MSSEIAPADFLAVENLLGKYQWYVDDGDAAGWTSLFTADGVFDSAFYKARIKGHDALKAVPRNILKQYGDRMRHHLGSLHMTYGTDRNEIVARYYSLVTTWLADEGAKFNCMALYVTWLIRVDGDWKITVAKTEIL
jgi:hypothetical protein